MLTESAAPHDQIKLPRSYYVKSSPFGYLHTLPDLVIFAAGLVGIGWGPWALKALCSLVISVVAYRMTFIIHDTSHGTLFGRRGENKLVGWLTSSLIFVSFPAFQRLHWVHHLHYRRAEDPQGTDYNDLVPGRDHVLWHLVKPLFALNIVEKLANFLSLAHCGMTPQEQRDARPLLKNAGLSERVSSTASILAAQTLILAVVTRGFAFPWGVVFLVPIPLVGLFLSRLRSYLEHGDLVHTDEPGLIARTHRSNFIERNILCSILFNYHNEHHRWPQVPSRLLPHVYQEITAGKIQDRSSVNQLLSGWRENLTWFSSRRSTRSGSSMAAVRKLLSCPPTKALPWMNSPLKVHSDTCPFLTHRRKSL